jgi:hypothetical protein
MRIKMKKRNDVRAVYIAMAVFASFMITACQSLPLQSPEKHLEKRVVGMMTARVDQNWAEVYKYMAPSYKKKMSKESFAGMKRDILYKNFTIESVKIDGSGKNAVVMVKYDMTVMTYPVSGHRETQEWIKQGFNWYFQIKEDAGM